MLVLRFVYFDILVCYLSLQNFVKRRNHFSCVFFGIFIVKVVRLVCHDIRQWEILNDFTIGWIFNIQIGDCKKCMHFLTFVHRNFRDVPHYYRAVSDILIYMF